MIFRETEPYLTEIAGVMSGFKPVIYAHYDDEHWDYIEALCRRFGLKYLKSNARPNAAKAFRKIAFIGKSEKALREGSHYSRRETSSPKEWGRMLGYPKCCVDFYYEKDRKVREALKRRGNWMEDIIPKAFFNTRSAGPFSFMLNNVFFFHSRRRASDPARDLADYQTVNALNRRLNLSSLHLIYWHPCSYDCKTSLKRAGLIHAFLKEHDPGLAAKVRVCLSRPVLYLDKYRFVVLDGEVQADGEAAYKGIAPPFSLADEEFTRSLRRRGRLTRAETEAPGRILLNFK